jgi:hypothetical protein
MDEMTPGPHPYQPYCVPAGSAFPDRGTVPVLRCLPELWLEISMPSFMIAKDFGTYRIIYLHDECFLTYEAGHRLSWASRATAVAALAIPAGPRSHDQNKLSGIGP